MGRAVALSGSPGQKYGWPEFGAPGEARLFSVPPWLQDRGSPQGMKVRAAGEGWGKRVKSQLPQQGGQPGAGGGRTDDDDLYRYCSVPGKAPNLPPGAQTQACPAREVLWGDFRYNPQGEETHV